MCDGNALFAMARNLHAREQTQRCAGRAIVQVPEPTKHREPLEKRDGPQSKFVCDSLVSTSATLDVWQSGTAGGSTARAPETAQLKPQQKLSPRLVRLPPRVAGGGSAKEPRCEVDGLTSVPKSLFEDLLRRGREVRFGGQHVRQRQGEKSTSRALVRHDLCVAC